MDRKRKIKQAVCCAAAVLLAFSLRGDSLPPTPRPGGDLFAVEQQLRALTADTPGGWRYSLRISPGGETLLADATRRDTFAAREAIHTVWHLENHVWRMVRLIRENRAASP